MKLTKSKTPQKNSPKNTPIKNEKKSPKNTPKNGINKKQSQTPNPPKSFTPKGTPTGKAKTPKSAPPATKHKKLEQEIDEELSDEEFETKLTDMKQKATTGKKKKGAVPVQPELDSDGEDDDDDLEEDSDMDDDSDDDIDDDSDDDSDEDEEEAQPAAKSKAQKKNGKAKAAVEEESDEDDDSDDDEDMDEDEDEDSEEEGPTPAKKSKASKESAEKKSKDKKKSEKVETEKAKAGEKRKQVLSPEDQAADDKRREDLDKSKLFIKNLASDTTEDEIRALSSDIELVTFRQSFKGKNQMRGFAYLTFKSEKLAEKNFKTIKGKKIRDREVSVDFVGAKSKSEEQMKNKHQSGQIDPKKLYITGFPLTTTQEELKALIPSALAVHLPVKKRLNKPIGYAFAFFENEAKAKSAHEELQGQKVDGRILVVLFAKKSAHSADTPIIEKKKPSKATIKTEETKAEKTKPIKEEESDDDEDDDDDTSEEDDDEDDDDDEGDDSDDDDDSDDE